MDPIINFLNDILWGYVLIYGLLAVGLFFTIRLGFVQFVHFPELFRSVLGSNTNDKSGITPFQALCTSLASRVGTGNLAGVAVALYLGGPGALFWMWMVRSLVWRQPMPSRRWRSSTRSAMRTATIAVAPHST